MSTINEVLIPGGARFTVHFERLMEEFHRGLILFRESSACCDPVCTVGSIRFAALRSLAKNRTMKPLRSFFHDELSDSLNGRAFLKFSGVLVIREEGPDTIKNPFRFV
ncbi:MAG: hypothetical protein HOO67_05465 [Candidatus Peribacteraceae bacterium]|nr:hypothetical protein [Candidatus Peribacteraceae bacterium]